MSCGMAFHPLQTGVVCIDQSGMRHRPVLPVVKAAMAMTRAHVDDGMGRGQVAGHVQAGDGGGVSVNGVEHGHGRRV